MTAAATPEYPTSPKYSSEGCSILMPFHIVPDKIYDTALHIDTANAIRIIREALGIPPGYFGNQGEPFQTV